MLPNCAKHHILLFFFIYLFSFQVLSVLVFLSQVKLTISLMHYKENNVVSTGVVLSLVCLLFYYFPFFEISLLSSFYFFILILIQSSSKIFLRIFLVYTVLIVLHYLYFYFPKNEPFLPADTHTHLWNLACFLFWKQPF